MTVEQLEQWFQKHLQDKNYQHKGMSDHDLEGRALDSFDKIPKTQRDKVLSVCTAYGITPEKVLRYRFMAQTNLFALCHLLEKYRDCSDKEYIWTDGTVHNVHEEVCNSFMVQKDPTKNTFKQFATEYVDLKERLLLVPRGGFKSSIDMADCVQWVINYSEITIMILTGVLDLANDFVKEIRGHFKLDDGEHEDVNLMGTKKAIKPRTMQDGTPFMFQVLFAEHCIAKDDGRASEFQTPAASLIEKECTIFAASIDQNLSGWHVGVMKLDDVV